MTARRHAVILAYLALALVFTYPLVTRFSTHVMGGKYDSYEYLWKLWWIPHALTTGADPFFAPHIYFPYGYSLAYGEITPIHTVLLMPLTVLLGDVTTYNLSIIAATVLTGWFTFIMARRWLARLAGDGDETLLTLAAFFAGAVFAFCVYRQSKWMGHLNLVDTQWLVLAVYAFDGWLERRRTRDAVLTALAISCAALSSWYYAYMLGLLLPVYLLGYGVNLKLFFTTRSTWTAAALVGVIVGGLCLPFLIPLLQLDTSGATKITLDDATFWAASPTDYIVPNPFSPLWGEAVKQVVWHFPTPMITEFVISISLLALVLGLYGSRVTKGRHWRALKWVMIVAFVLSLGPILTLARLPLGIPLPDLLLREILPGADSIRSWGRFSVMVTLGFALLSGAGLLIAVRQSQRIHSAARRYGVVIAITALLLIELWGGAITLVRAEPRPVDRWLAQQADDAPIMEFPLSEALSGPGLYYTRFHGKPITYGYGTYLPLIYPKRHPALLNFPADEALDQLEQWGVHYVLVTTDSLDYEAFTRADVAAQARLEYVATFDNVDIFRLR